jgi:hypothetical protein
MEIHYLRTGAAAAAAASAVAATSETSETSAAPAWSDFFLFFEFELKNKSKLRFSWDALLTILQHNVEKTVCFHTSQENL